MLGLQSTNVSEVIDAWNSSECRPESTGVDIVSTNASNTLRGATVAITRDSLILKITQGGDPLSWEEFFAIYRPFLFGVVKRSGVQDQDASDIVQDVFVTLIRALPQFEYQSEKGRFRGWLKTLVRNTTIDWFRRRGRAREVPLDEMRGTPDLPADDCEWDAAYRTQVVNVALQRLEAESQSTTWFCFDQHILKGRQASEVGSECGLAAGAVYVNASRTLARLRRKCAACDTDLSLTADRDQ